MLTIIIIVIIKFHVSVCSICRTEFVGIFMIHFQTKYHFLAHYLSP